MTSSQLRISAYPVAVAISGSLLSVPELQSAELPRTEYVRHLEQALFITILSGLAFMACSFSAQFLTFHL